MTGDEYEKPEVDVLGSIDDLDGQVGGLEDFASTLPPADEPPEAGCNCRHLPFGATCIFCRQRLGTSDPVPITDGRGCWYCNLSEYHPTCDRPGCDNQTHGRDEEGKTVPSYCAACRGGSA